MENELTKLLRTSLFMSVGIVPIDIRRTHKDFNRYLASLPPDEARKMKRKFRKLWRKFVKNPKGVKSHYLQQLGKGAENPTRRQKQMRKVEVLRMIDKIAHEKIEEVKSSDNK
jgi:hypothetical protein